MRIFAFIEQYCKDLIDDAKKLSDMVDLSGFPYDAILTMSDGEKVPVIYVGPSPIPIADIMRMEKPEFAMCYTEPAMAEAYDNYLENVIVLEGEDAVMRIRKSIEKSVRNLEEDLKNYRLVEDML